MKIAFIRETDNKRIRIGVEDGGEITRYTVSPATYSMSGAVRGAEIDEAVLDLFIADDTSYRAMSRALSLLSYGDNTRSSLFMKLTRSGFSREVAEECVAECVRLGYIDERRQIERAALNEANRSLRGRSYIIKKLRSKGYSASDIGSVIDGLVESGEIDFSLNFERLCEKRGVCSEDERRALLYKYGYRSADC